jgi:hypothetical protein
MITRYRCRERRLKEPSQLDQGVASPLYRNSCLDLNVAETPTTTTSSEIISIWVVSRGEMHALAKLITPLSQKLHLSTLPFHIHHVVAAYLLYEAIFRFISPSISRRLFRTYRHSDQRSRVDWDTHVVSMVQCLLINAMALHVIFYEPERARASKEGNWRERLWGYTPTTGRVQGFAAGYFLWGTLHFYRIIPLIARQSSTRSLIKDIKATRLCC